LQEFERLQGERVNAFQEFYNDVQEGVFPDKKNVVEIDKKELDIFLNSLEKKN
jgi:3-methyl-2-oxobutanoate hydroxymethyltransferase